MGSVKCERNADNVTVRKKFSFAEQEKKDNFLAEMDVDLVNARAQPYSNPGYFRRARSAAPTERKIIRITPSRLVHRWLRRRE